MALLRAHHRAIQGPDGAGGRVTPTRAASHPLYSIIIELFDHSGPTASIERVVSELGALAVQWVHLGPPALQHAEAVSELRARGVVRWVGVEDFSPAMLEAAWWGSNDGGDDDDDVKKKSTTDSATTPVATANAAAAVAVEDDEPGLSILCRTREQAEAALTIPWLNEVVLDFLVRFLPTSDD